MQLSSYVRGPMRLLGLLLKRKMSRDGQRVLDELRHRVERGAPHPRKLDAMAKLSLVAARD